MEGQPCGTNGVFKIRRIPYGTTEKLGESHESNKRSIKEHEEAIQ